MSILLFLSFYFCLVFDIKHFFASTAPTHSKYSITVKRKNEKIWKKILDFYFQHIQSIDFEGNSVVLLKLIKAIFLAIPLWAFYYYRRKVPKFVVLVWMLIFD